MKEPAARSRQSGARIAKSLGIPGDSTPSMSAPDSRLLAPASSSSRAAFTLLELLVVIGIIALISAIALPVLRSFKPDPLKTASNQLLNDLAYARHRAIADHTIVYVCFMPPLNLLSNLTVNSSYLLPDIRPKLLKSQ